MSARRFFVEGVRTSGERIEIEGSDAHKIVNVLRLRDGDTIAVIDSAARTFEATLHIDAHRVRATIVRPGIVPEREATNERVDLAQGLPKGQKMDYIIEKATELGVSSILPFTSERAIARSTGHAKAERWRRIATAASQQSGRLDIPAIEHAQPFTELLSRFTAYDCVLFAWELAPPIAMHEVLPQLLQDATRILLVVGPEGGFSHAEAEAAQCSGAHALHLGSRILRTETAGVMLLSIVAYLGRL